MMKKIMNVMKIILIIIFQGLDESLNDNENNDYSDFFICSSDILNNLIESSVDYLPVSFRVGVLNGS